MKPKWGLLVYVAVEALVISALVVLASFKTITLVPGLFEGNPPLLVDRWLAGLAIIGLGVLPWPAVLAFGRAMIWPRKPREWQVLRHPAGPVAVALTALDDEEATADVVRDFVMHPTVARVIIVDNGSADRTREVAAAAGAQVVVESRRGFGYVCRRALSEGLASGLPAVVLCEADRTFRAADLDQMVAYLRYADLVAGTRTYSALLNSNSQLNSFLILGNLLVAKLLQLRYWNWVSGGPVRLTDVGCTYMAVRADALPRILPYLEAGGSHFVPHLLMVALERGLQIVQVPVTFWKRVGVSKGGSASWRKGFALGCVMLWHIFIYRVRPAPASDKVSGVTLSEADRRSSGRPTPSGRPDSPQSPR